jgi:ABC-type uncharacterized transport system auxiliary subunit
VTDLRLKRFALLLVGVSTLLGCVAGTRVPEDSFYRLDIGLPNQALEKPVLEGVLLVEVVAAAPIYRDRSFLYSDNTATARLRRHHYLHWIDSPPHLLEQGLEKYLSNAGVAALVVTPEERIDQSYRLLLSLERFEHVRDQASGTVVVEAKLMLSKRGIERPLRHKRIKAEAVVQRSDFASVVASYQRCVESLFAQVQATLVGSD